MKAKTDGNNEIDIIFVGPKSYWRKMKSGFSNLPWEIKYFEDGDWNLQKIAEELEKIEAVTWQIPNPAFIRSNFGLYGPGVIMMACIRGVCIGSLYFVGPFSFDKRIHIWNIVVHKDYRGMGIASSLLTTAVTSVQGCAKVLTYQTKVYSDSIPLYLRLGPNKVLAVHVSDSNGDWDHPKIMLQAKLPNNPLEIMTRKLVPSIENIIWAEDSDATFWKKLSKKVASSENIFQLVGCSFDDKGKRLGFVRAASCFNDTSLPR
jgi:GNAT superfamily N-acetyltransferase